MRSNETARADARNLNCTRLDLRSAGLCAGIVIAAALLTWPVAEIAFDDDWSYAFTALRLARSGHVLYNGWSAPMILPQALYGAALIKLFGFSFTLLRLSNLPWVFVTSLTSFLLGRALGLRPIFAAMTSLTLGLSPFFLPLETSFMTDVPGIMCLLVCLYALIRCARAAGGRATGWLAVAIIVGCIGGMNRQLVWAMPLVLLPYLVLLRRRNARFCFNAIIGWLIVLLDMVISARWFSRQPYAIVDPPLTELIQRTLSMPMQLGWTMVAYCLTILQASFPAVILFAIAWIARTIRRPSGARIVAIALALAAVICFATFFPEIFSRPLMGNIVTMHGVLGDATLAGNRPRIIPPAGVFAIAIISLACLAIVLSEIFAWLGRPRNAVTKAIRRVFDPDERSLAWSMAAIFCIIYFVLLLARCCENWIFDRYAMVFVPFVTAALLLACQDFWWTSRGRARAAMLIGGGLLLLLGAYAVMSTQEIMALGRARSEATTRLMAAGVPRTAIDGGGEFNFWTQAASAGWINNPMLPAPPYRPDRTVIPSVRPRYFVEFSRGRFNRPSEFGSIEYLSWLPPFHRRILIDRYMFGGAPPWWTTPGPPLVSHQ